MNKRLIWIISFSANILTVKKNAILSSVYRCKKKSLKSCTNCSPRVSIMIKTLQTCFASFLPALTPCKAVTSEVCLYVFIQIELQNRCSRLSHDMVFIRCLLQSFKASLTFYHIQIANFSPTGPFYFYNKLNNTFTEPKKSLKTSHFKAKFEILWSQPCCPLPTITSFLQDKWLQYHNS